MISQKTTSTISRIKGFFLSSFIFIFHRISLEKFKKWLYFFLVLLIAAILIPNWIIIKTTQTEIFKDLSQIKTSDTGIILGAAVYGSRHASPIVQDRIITAVNLYKGGKIKNLLISGDHGQKYYNEVSVIKNLLLKYDIPEKDIVLDHSGFSTYESISRANTVFGVRKTIIITQCFHLPRAIFLAHRNGMHVQGLCADRRTYRNYHWYVFREYLARVKDFFYIDVFRPKPTSNR